MPPRLLKLQRILWALGLLSPLLFWLAVQAQQYAPASGESLTLDQAIALALRDNHAMKIAKLDVERADEDISAAKTYRLPSLHAYTSVSSNLANNAVIEPLTQQYRIGLNIKSQRVSREIAQAKLRQQQSETIDLVKKAYYAVLQTRSALSSVEEALKSYHELDKVTSDNVLQQVSLRADLLVVQTRLAKVEYEQLELTNQLATQKEQLNTLLGRSVDTSFEVAGVPEFTAFETDVAAARKIALERRPELQQARLVIEQATLDRRIKKSEYIPDVSAGFVYLTPRNYAPVIPKNFANVGVVVSWEFFDWGRKKHQLSEKDKAVEQAKNGLKEKEDQVLIDVGDKLRKLQQSAQALRVAKLEESSARENLRVSTGRYKFQEVLLSDVLQSQAFLAEATHEYQRALLAFWTAKAEFEKALGEDK